MKILDILAKKTGYYNFFFVKRLFHTFGFIGTIRVSLAHFFKLDRIKIKLKPINKTIRLRPYTADFVTIKHVFWDEIYDVGVDKSAQFIVDCGANVGYSSLAFAWYFPNATVIAVEPEKNNFKILKENTSGVSNIVPLKKAVWHTNEELFLQNPKATNNSFSFTPFPVESETIMGITIKDIIRQYSADQIDLLKIDIEGAEEDLFSSVDLDWLSKVNVLVIEPHSAKIERLIVEKLTQSGFTKTKKGEKLIFRKTLLPHNFSR